MLLRLTQVLSPEQVTGIVEALDTDAPWVDGRVTAGHQGAQVKRNLQLDERSELARALGRQLLATLENNALFVSATLPHRVYPPVFNRFEADMHFGNHVDGAVRRVPGSGQKLRADLSATLFLVPPDAYDGGELVIERGADAQSFKLGVADLIVYPTTSMHRVTAVTRGVRLASVLWIQSLVRDETQRDMLFELDRTIQRLTQSGADRQSLVTLASHYHNLLRQWAEV